MCDVFMAGGTQLLLKTVALVSAHKRAIGDMVEVGNV